MDRNKKIEWVKDLLWDYSYDPVEMLELLEGKRQRVGHYTRRLFFRKLIENYPWFVVIQILPISDIKELLDDDMISRLRFQSMRHNYSFARNRLQTIIQAAV
jgi:hypothetical protein